MTHGPYTWKSLHFCYIIIPLCLWECMPGTCYRVESCIVLNLRQNSSKSLTGSIFSDTKGLSNHRYARTSTSINIVRVCQIALYYFLVSLTMIGISSISTLKFLINLHSYELKVRKQHSSLRRLGMWNSCTTIRSQWFCLNDSLVMMYTSYSTCIARTVFFTSLNFKKYQS